MLLIAYPGFYKRFTASIKRLPDEAGAFGAGFFCERSDRYLMDTKENKTNEGLDGEEMEALKETEDSIKDENDTTAECSEKINSEEINSNEEKDVDEEKDPNKELNDIKNELEKKTSELADLQQRYIRLQADFDNYRKRVRREQQEITNRATIDLVSNLLTVLDNLERALAAVNGNVENDNLATGVEMTLRQFKDILGKEGLTPIEALGQPFNPDLHEAIAREETNDEEKVNMVVEEFRQGYTLKGKLLRPAMVKVAVAEGTGN
ncbi:MAG: molecular chaperone GrpE [Clostridia bacterium]|nr:molecular chaperone GrpE [Clostridia bacterium]